MKKIHPVVKVLLNRKNKKVPIKDGNKITLFLFGGAMAGVNGAAAAIAFEEMGLSNSFNEIYSSSAGFCNASYMLSGNTKEGTSLYYEDLSGRKFLNFLHPWHIENTDYLVNCMKNIKVLNVKKILNSKTKIFVRVNDVKKQKEIFIEAHKFSEKEYFKLIKAAISMPFLSPGNVKIKNKEYKDIISDDNWSNLILEKIKNNKNYIIFIYNTEQQYKYVHQTLNGVWNKKNVLEIKPNKNHQLSRTETNSEVLKKSCTNFGNKIKKIFNNKNHISLKY